MSFILDAVKKSEQDRRFAHAQPLQSWYAQGSAQKPQNQWWIGGLVVLNTIVLAGLVLWVVQPQWLVKLQEAPQQLQSTEVGASSTLKNLDQAETNPENSQNPTVLEKPQTQPVSGNQTVLNGADSDQLDIIGPGQSQNLASEPVDEIITPTPPIARPYGFQPNEDQTQTALDLSNVQALEALPESLVIHIPAIAFSSHLYSSESNARQVVVNGQKLREGEYLNRDLQLLKIEEKSVIFQQFQTPFRVLLARYWVQSE